MGLHLTLQDGEKINHLRKIDVLKEVDGYRLDRRDGVMLNTCADCDQFFDLFTKEVEHVSAQCKGPRVHTFAFNGGSLRLAVRGIHLRWLGRVLFWVAKPILGQLGVPLIDPLEEVIAAQNMKGIGTVALYTHAPCGYAYAQNWSFEDIVDRLFLAKDNLKATIKGVRVACFVHVRHEDGRPRTYFIARDSWMAYRKNPEELRSVA